MPGAERALLVEVLVVLLWVVAVCGSYCRSLLSVSSLLLLFLFGVAVAVMRLGSNEGLFHRKTRQI